jgi:hypothetical protein
MPEILCKSCALPVHDGQNFVRVRADRTQRSMDIYHAEHAPESGKVRAMSAKYRQAITEYDEITARREAKG